MLILGRESDFQFRISNFIQYSYAASPLKLKRFSESILPCMVGRNRYRNTRNRDPIAISKVSL